MLGVDRFIRHPILSRRTSAIRPTSWSTPIDCEPRLRVVGGWRRVTSHRFREHAGLFRLVFLSSGEPTMRPTMIVSISDPLVTGARRAWVSANHSGPPPPYDPGIWDCSLVRAATRWPDTARTRWMSDRILCSDFIGGIRSAIVVSLAPSRLPGSGARNRPVRTFSNRLVGFAEGFAGYGLSFGDFTRLHRRGLIACAYRAAEWNPQSQGTGCAHLFQPLDDLFRTGRPR